MTHHAIICEPIRVNEAEGMGVGCKMAGHVNPCFNLDAKCRKPVTDNVARR